MGERALWCSVLWHARDGATTATLEAHQLHGGPWSRSWLHLRLRASGPFVLRPKHFRRCLLPWNPKLEWEGPSPRATVRWEMQEFWRCEMDMYVGAGVCVTTVD